MLVNTWGPEGGVGWGAGGEAGGVWRFRVMH